MRNTQEAALQSRSAPARLIESALDLARAEGALALVHVREVAVRAIGALLATIVAASFAQVAIVLAVLSPLLHDVLSVTSIVFAVGVPALLALGCAWIALTAWRRIPREAPPTSHENKSWADETPSET